MYYTYSTAKESESQSHAANKQKDTSLVDDTILTKEVLRWTDYMQNSPYQSECDAFNSRLYL